MSTPEHLPTGFPDRPHLRESRPIEWGRATTSPAARGIISALVAELEGHENRKRARRPDDRLRMETTLEAIVLDLFVAAEQDARLYIAYSRRQEDYSSTPARYLRPNITYTASIEAADFLAKFGYAEGKTGSYSRQNIGGFDFSKGYRSRLRATDKLTNLFRQAGVQRRDVHQAEVGEVIRLKSPPSSSTGKKSLLPYEDDENTHRMRVELKAWLAIAAKTDFKVTQVSPQDLQEDTDDDEAAYMDCSETRLYRVFNDGEWTRGGRFYGGWWLSLPKVHRKTIMIDGEPTVELDFKAFHPRILYHLNEKPMAPDDDPYFLPEFPRLSRDLLKVAFNQLLAIRGDAKPKKPRNANLPKGLSYAMVVIELERKHWQIASWMRAGLAARVQFFDSQVAELVMKTFTFRYQRPILPVHDSFIVAAQDEVRLGKAMAFAFIDVMKRETDIERAPMISGWSSSEVEAEVNRAIHDYISDDL